MVEAKLLRKKLKNGLIVDKWDLVNLIEQQEKEISAKNQRIMDLEDKLGKGVLGELLRENDQLKRLGVPDDARQKLHEMEIKNERK